MNPTSKKILEQAGQPGTGNRFENLMTSGECLELLTAAATGAGHPNHKRLLKRMPSAHTLSLWVSTKKRAKLLVEIAEGSKEGSEYVNSIWLHQTGSQLMESHPHLAAKILASCRKYETHHNLLEQIVQSETLHETRWPEKHWHWLRQYEETERRGNPLEKAIKKRKYEAVAILGALCPKLIETLNYHTRQNFPGLDKLNPWIRGQIQNRSELAEALLSWPSENEWACEPLELDRSEVLNWLTQRKQAPGWSMSPQEITRPGRKLLLKQDSLWTTQPTGELAAIQLTPRIWISNSNTTKKTQMASRILFHDLHHPWIEMPFTQTGIAAYWIITKDNPKTKRNRLINTFIRQWLEQPFISDTTLALLITNLEAEDLDDETQDFTKTQLKASEIALFKTITKTGHIAETIQLKLKPVARLLKNYNWEPETLVHIL